MTRKLKILIGAILVGIILILVELFTSTDVNSAISKNPAPPSPQKSIENDIKAIKEKEFSPILLTTINSQIHAAFSNGLISKSTEDLLKSDLKDVYSAILYQKCDNYLKNEIGNSNSILVWLKDFNRKFKDSKASFYISQINAYNYYTHGFIDKINSLTGKECFDENNYNSIKNELLNLSRLDIMFKSSAIITKMKSSRFKQLQDFYNFYAYEPNQFPNCSNLNVAN
jgi:hypothetical protein